jgi:2-oxo-4-hydroxy-4-carboxy--5-ureidoimidazoline (OHCU) decarboxylase
MTIDALNHLEREAAEAEFTRCCGSTAWARSMAAARPFASLDALVRAGDVIWRALAPGDWLEAFAAHPKIGEQAGNEDYQSRFGYIFIVCATGKTAAEMLAALEDRLTNDPAVELRVAAEEQRKITGLRLAKLMDGHS